MAKDTVTDCLEQVFNGRRYCPNCGAMTPIYIRDPSAANAGHDVDVCDKCMRCYDPIPFQRMKIKETYGIAIVDQDAIDKMVKVVKKW